MLPIGARFRGCIELTVVDVTEPSIEEPIPEPEQGSAPAWIANVRQACENPMGALPLGVGIPKTISKASHGTGEECANAR